MTEATEHSMAQTKKLLNSKENFKKREREKERKDNLWEQEKISANHISNKRLITQNI